MAIQKGPRVLEVDEELLEDILLSKRGGTLVEVKPYRDSDRGMSDTVEMFRAFHNTKTKRGRNVSPTNSFEIWYDGKNARFLVYIADEHGLKRGVRHISSNFPGAKLNIPSEASQQTIPTIQKGDYIVGTRMRLKNHYFEPIRSPAGVEDYVEPYRNILPEVISESNVRCLVQILFKPAGTDWTSSAYEDAAEYADKISSNTSQSRIKKYSNEEASKGPSELGRYASLIKRQIGQPGYYINLRVITISEDENLAVEENDAISKDFVQYYREFSGQSFKPVHQKGERIRELISDVVKREGEYMSKQHGFISEIFQNTDKFTVMTIPELAALAHFPTGDTLNTNAIDWEKLDSTNRLPSKAPKYDEVKNNNREVQSKYDASELPIDSMESQTKQNGD